MDQSNVRDIVNNLINISDKKWYVYTIKKDPYYKKLTNEEVKEIIEKSMDAASKEKDKILEVYGKISPVDYLEKLQLEMERVDDVIMEYLYFALLDGSKRKVTLNEGTINLVEEYIRNNELEDILLKRNSELEGNQLYKDNIFENDYDKQNICKKGIESITIMHEVYHYMEHLNPQIYTRTKMLNRKLCNIISYNKGIISAGEIGAIHFSKLMCDLKYSPCIYEIILLLATGNTELVESIVQDINET